jgi:hypothetical protein
VCCLFSVLALLGPRAALIVYWLLYPASWTLAFGANWFVPLLGFLVLPWTTMAYVFVFPNGLDFLDWLLIGLALVVDIGSVGGGAFGNRDRVQSYYSS